MKDQVIWKYVIHIEDEFSLEIPVNSRILSVQNQRGSMCMWVLVRHNNSKERRYFRIFGTGHRINEEKISSMKTFIGSVQFDDLVFHLFECTNK